jgi:2-polyprenyl-3-methyl-5-hydroxy-6-metoxy-1,4-benzoquinol methylase
VLTTDIVDLATAETLAFIERHLQMRANGASNATSNAVTVRTSEDFAGISGGSDSLRLLEVGCGKGQLAAALAGKGLCVRAVDVSEEAVVAAKARGVDCLRADFLTYEDEPFDVLLFARSLHHISPLDLAVEKAAALLSNNGLILVEDFGADRADAAALVWLAQMKFKAVGAGLCGNTDRHQEAMSGSLEQWHHYYYQKHKIADSQTMFEAAQKSFAHAQVETAPYLYRYLLDIVKSDAAGIAFVQEALAEEKSLIAQDKIAAVGWRLSCSKAVRGRS